MKRNSAEQEKDLIFNKIYQVQKKISSGSFGVVYSGLNLKTQEQLALKLEKNNNSDEIVSVLREATLLEKLQGLRGIPKYYWAGTKGTYDCMVLELLGKDLGSYLKIFKNLSLSTVVNLGYELLVLLEKIHENSIVHRDLKPENILIGRGDNQSQVYIVDFGISKLFKGEKNINFFYLFYFIF